MKNLILLLFLYGTVSAQRPSCCSPSVNDKNTMLAMNEEFAKEHLPPTPFVLEGGKGKMVEYKTPDGKTAKAYVVKSDKPTNKVLFIFHEWWGLNDYIKQEAEKYHNELGDVDVYALDLYDGDVATEVPQAQKYMGRMQEDRGKAIIKGAIEFVGPNAKITSLGWCFGGGWSLQSALLEGKQAVGCVMYYGMPETDLNKLKTLNCDVLGFFALQDQHISPTVVKQFQADMKKTGKKITVYSYDAVHAFANPSNPKYNKEYAEDAHTKAVAYLREKLK